MGLDQKEAWIIGDEVMRFRRGRRRFAGRRRIVHRIVRGGGRRRRRRVGPMRIGFRM